MKKIITISILMILLSTTAEAQLFERLKNKLFKEVEKQTEKKIENAVDTVFNSGNSKTTSPKTSKKKTESQKTQRNEEVEKGFFNILPSDGATNIEIPVKFSWDIKNINIEQYGHEFYLHTDDDVSSHMIGGPKKKKFTYEKLEPNTTYYWRVVAAGDAGYFPAPIYSFTTAKETKVNWSKYDFMPGDEIIFEDAPDMNEENGEFPSRWDLKRGTFEIAEVDDINVIYMRGSGNMHSGGITPLMKNRTEDYLPEAFTIEFDAFYKKGLWNQIYYITFYDKKKQSHINGLYQMEMYYSQGRYSDIVGNIQDTPSQPENDCWKHIAISFNKRSLKLYSDQTRVLNIPNIENNPTGITLSANMGSKDFNNYFIKNIRIAKGAKPLYKRAFTDGKIIVHGITFDIGKASLKPTGIGPINKIYKLMKKNKDLKFSVEGHTDSDGSDDSNMKLSKERAKTIVAKLIELGISSDRLSSKGFGESKPLSDNDSPEGKANNRRVEFIRIK